MSAERWCPRCEATKPIAEFRLVKTKGGGTKRNAYCQTCWKLYQKEWYAKLPKKRRAARRSRAVARRNELRDRLYDYLLTHPCEDCGEGDPVVLEFDHVGTDKSANISHLMKNCCSWERVETEITKCRVRCANCHRRVTARRAGFWRDRMREQTCQDSSSGPTTSGSAPSASGVVSRAPSAARNCRRARRSGAGESMSGGSGGR